jgi:hypothetical protein
VISPTVAAQSLSLLQIQQQEQEYLEKAKKPAMRSFAEIIEQEEKDRKEEERTAAEIEYDRWLQQEIARNEGSSSASRGKPRGGGGRVGQRKVPTRGKAQPAVVRDPASVRIDDEPLSAGHGHGQGQGSRGRGGGRGRGRGGPPGARGGINGHGHGHGPAHPPAPVGGGTGGQGPTHRA